MKLTTNYPTLTYEVDGGFLISVIGNTSKCLWEAWIRISDYGIARHMFSIPMDGHPLEEFIDMVENHIAAAREDYAIEYMGV